MAEKNTMGTAFLNGIEDRHSHGLHWHEGLYRPTTLHVAWRLGWEVANMLTTRGLRTAK